MDTNPRCIHGNYILIYPCELCGLLTDLANLRAEADRYKRGLEQVREMVKYIDRTHIENEILEAVNEALRDDD
jgi:hypothetical protein